MRTKLALGAILITGLVAGLAGPWARFAPTVFAPPLDAQEAPRPAVTSHTPDVIGIARGIVDVEGGIVTLASNRDGVVRQVFVEEGDRVRKDQVLAIQDDRIAHVQLRVAEAEVAEQRAQIGVLEQRLATAMREKRLRESLIGSGASSRKSFDDATEATQLIDREILARKAAIDTAMARRDLAAYEVEQRVIRAPDDGVIVRRLARPGDGASTLNVTPLFWFAPAAARIVRAEIDERFAAQIKAGFPVEVQFEFDDAQKLTGKVARIGHIFGARRQQIYEPRDRQDVRVVEAVITLDESGADLILGQRVIARILRPRQATLN